jgi:hypothetical protein
MPSMTCSVRTLIGTYGSFVMVGPGIVIKGAGAQLALPLAVAHRVATGTLSGTIATTSASRVVGERLPQGPICGRTPMPLATFLHAFHVLVLRLRMAARIK